jgi:hypothetical protein
LAAAEKGALEEGRTILFVDQSGFYLLPCVVHTYAPVGQTPVLREQLSRDHLSVISGISLEGKLFMMEQKRAFKGEDVVRFLKHLLRQISGKLLVVWDGSPIHHGRAVRDFLASGASHRLQLEQLPFSTLRISIPAKGSGSTSSTQSSRTFAAKALPSYGSSYAEPRSA